MGVGRGGGGVVKGKEAGGGGGGGGRAVCTLNTLACTVRQSYNLIVCCMEIIYSFDSLFSNTPYYSLFARPK